MRTMEERTALLSIAVADAGEALRDGMTVDEMLKAAMKKAQDFFMSTDDDLRMRGAIGAVMVKLGAEHPEYTELVRSLDSLRKMSAFLQAASAGLNMSIDDDTFITPKYPLLKLWNESKN